jgi:hypothetical protein
MIRTAAPQAMTRQLVRSTDSRRRGRSQLCSTRTGNRTDSGRYSDVEKRPGFSDAFTVRDVTAMHLQTATTLWFENGTTVTVHADPEVRMAAVQVLRSANHEVLGVSEAGPGESLAEFGAAKLVP